MTHAVADRPGGASPVVLAVCGLAVEGRIASGPGVRVIAGGGRSEALAVATEQAIAAGAAAIISFGVAGALIPSLKPGLLIVASSIVGADETYPVDPAWSRAVASCLPGSISAPLAGCDAVVASTKGKRRLQIRTGASAVDMESHIAARIARRHGLPFVAVRAIADPLHRSLPAAATVAMREDGGVDLFGVLRSVGRAPRQLPQLLRIGLDAQRALRSLGRGRRALGRGLGYLDLDQLPVDVV